MKCKKFKEQIILFLYGELNELQVNDLENHTKECSECAQDLAYTQEVFKLMEETDTEEIPVGDWEKCWKGVHNNIQSPRRQKYFGPFPRWAAAASAAVMVLVVGILIGRFWMPSKPSVQPDTGISSEYVQATLQEHFESLKPLLKEYVNYTGLDKEDDFIVIDRGIIRSLLIQNFLLMKIITKEDTNAALLLEDIELVLREITNIDSGDNKAPSMIKKLIDQRDILFKLEILQKT